jgi:hypothetical protein
MKIKKVLPFLLAMALLLLICFSTEHSSWATSFTYEMKNKQLRITGIKGKSGTINIPSKIGKKKIVSIYLDSGNFNIINVRGKYIKDIYLNSAKIKQINFLEKKMKIEALWLEGNNLNNINLSNLPKLEYLNLGLNNVKEIKGLTKCKKLENLNLEANGYSGTLDLSGTKKIKELTLMGNKINKIKGITKQKKLEFLNAEKIGLEGELNFNGFKKLRTLIIGSNKITNLTLKNCKALTYLNISSNRIKHLDISTLKNLNNLLASENKNLKIIGLNKVKPNYLFL